MMLFSDESRIQHKRLELRVFLLLALGCAVIWGCAVIGLIDVVHILTHKLAQAVLP